MFLGESLGPWRSKKQVKYLGAKVEFRARAQDVHGGFWIKIILCDLKIRADIHMSLYCDN